MTCLARAFVNSGIGPQGLTRWRTKRTPFVLQECNSTSSASRKQQSTRMWPTSQHALREQDCADRARSRAWVRIACVLCLFFSTCKRFLLRQTDPAHLIGIQSTRSCNFVAWETPNTKALQSTTHQILKAKKTGQGHVVVELYSIYKGRSDNYSRRYGNNVWREEADLKASQSIPKHPGKHKMMRAAWESQISFFQMALSKP